MINKSTNVPGKFKKKNIIFAQHQHTTFPQFVLFLINDHNVNVQNSNDIYSILS